MPKKTKQEADYGPAKPSGDKCRACRWFEVERPRGCVIVEGTIEPDGWCKFFHERKVAGAALVGRSEARRRDMMRARHAE